MTDSGARIKWPCKELQFVALQAQSLLVGLLLVSRMEADVSVVNMNEKQSAN